MQKPSGLENACKYNFAALHIKIRQPSRLFGPTYSAPGIWGSHLKSYLNSHLNQRTTLRMVMSELVSVYVIGN